MEKQAGKQPIGILAQNDYAFWVTRGLCNTKYFSQCLFRLLKIISSSCFEASISFSTIFVRASHSKSWGSCFFHDNMKSKCAPCLNNLPGKG